MIEDYKNIFDLQCKIAKEIKQEECDELFCRTKPRLISRIIGKVLFIWYFLTSLFEDV